ncbi:hypothetical protein COV81_01730 [Candidatus Peregrinibacteria bacterium CG11_big_fil_rev_8_21_14_0_20_41_10]|nr:MAG: hypothetical protein COV81_01730 [Candidatus Peregrinibacteria bacterium CG11_big_fil_rev_8_21_14_0_20_41_10]PIZ76075.1 MAG: hypothetical protein COY06_02335 [Candidatus Peregrinibacteria bacterium CG_4_10_14_0_2_um_filter_41_8]PJC37589.1 MAG: hypothetical protein CO045_04730 [Candidatus Peregrinibacteria bacterium CG_4_9_14_0_2_um_filter_41_14]
MKKQLPYLFGLIGLVCLGLTFFFAYTQYQFTHSAILTNAVYTHIDKIQSNQNTKNPAYQPVATYKDQEGNEHTINSLVTSYNPQDDLIGKEVKIYFEAANPSKAVIAGIWNLWGASITFLIISIIFLIAGYYTSKQTV